MIQHPFNSTIEQSQIAEKIRDREIRGIRSTNIIQCYSDRENKDKIHKIKYLNDITLDLERCGPAGLLHIAILSNIIERPIKIWNSNGTLNKIIGRRKTGHSIDIEYHVTDSEEIGHWTLKGGKDPDNVIIDLNSCLFSVIASQIGQNPVRLRKWTALRLKNDLQNLAERIDKIFQLEGNDGVIRMIGGATYTGTCSNDAKMILNNSQGKSSSISRSAGHARGHASNPAIPLDDWKGSVENYTRVIPGHKSAFLSPADQDYVTDLALRTEQARKAMERLNSGSGQEVITISAENLKKLIPEDLDLPKMNIWRDGKPNGDEHDILMVRLILRHHENKSGDQNADVMIQTCLPISDKPREYPTVEEIKQIIRKKEQEEFREERER